jgi:catechol 2,3-dioxygenase-like lactoylglutathione lyase family enzyme
MVVAPLRLSGLSDQPNWPRRKPDLWRRSDVRAWPGRMIGAALLSISAWLASAPAQAAVLEVERICVTVSDLDRTEAFYRDGLGFRTVARREIDDPAMQHLSGVRQSAQTLTMQLGREQVEFVRFATPGREYPIDSRSPDLWFQHFAIVVSDMGAAYEKLRRVRFQPISEQGPETLPEEDGGVRAYKFRDPDGHPLELIYFPPGQGRALWSSPPPSAIDLGIDHTAIDVSNSAASKAFYGALLGMKVAYEVINGGPAQERLDGTFNAMVRITGLRPTSAEGPGVELLDYRSPPTGRRPPSDSRGDDVWHAHVVLRVDALDDLVGALDRADVRFVSPGVVRLPDGVRAAAVLDPDGHAVVIEQY